VAVKIFITLPEEKFTVGRTIILSRNWDASGHFVSRARSSSLLRARCTFPLTSGLETVVVRGFRAENILVRVKLPGFDTETAAAGLVTNLFW